MRFAQCPLFGAFSASAKNEDEQIIKDIKKCSMTGRPCGDDSFINKLEKLLGRRLGALPWEHQRKTDKTIK